MRGFNGSTNGSAGGELEKGNIIGVNNQNKCI